MAVTEDLGLRIWLCIQLLYNRKGSPWEINYHLAISYHLYLFYISKVSGMLHTGQWGDFILKNATLYLHFLVFFFVFNQKKIFLSFSFLFLGRVNFWNRILGNQSETGIGDKKLRLEHHNYYSKQWWMMFSLFKEVLKYNTL